MLVRAGETSADAEALLRPFPAERMTAHIMGQAIDNVGEPGRSADRTRCYPSEISPSVDMTFINFRLKFGQNVGHVTT
jgi:hypothetical protein